MINSVIAGFLIGMGGAMYLLNMGAIGAVIFSLGLLTILHFKFHLFTGKAGLLTTYEISPMDLGLIWCGNLIGSGICAGLIHLTPLAANIIPNAVAITTKRIENGLLPNIALGIFCGLLMYVAVSSYQTKPWVTVMCVAGFILGGFNHCIADMFYMWMASFSVNVGEAMAAIICTTFGNIIGCNLIPVCEKIRGRC